MNLHVVLLAMRLAALVLRIDHGDARLVVVEMPLDHRQRAFADGAEADHDDGAGDLRVDLRGGTHHFLQESAERRVRSGSGVTSLCGDFDLDLHLGLLEPRHDQQCRRRTDVAENLAADREMGVRVVDVGEVVGRADDVGHREAAFLEGSLDGLEAVP